VLNAQAMSYSEPINTTEFPPTKGLPSTSRTKVLLLTDSFLPHAGGSREYYYNIYQALVKLGSSEVAILTKKVTGWKEFDNRTSSALFRIRRRFKPLNSWKYHELPKGAGTFFHALWHALRRSPDIVHAGDLYPQGVTAMILKRSLGLPYIAYCHGEEVTQTDRYRYQPRVRDRIYRDADAVVCNSEFARQNLIRIGVQESTIYKITPGVDCTRFRPMPPRADLLKLYGLEGKLVLLTVARLIPRKGHKVALEAFAKISGLIRDAHYLIAGIGPEETRLRELVQQANLNERVTFTGFVRAEQLPDIYNLCDIMMMPNRQEDDGDVEGFGMVFLEANAAQKPVIGGRTGGAIEAINDGITGFLVDPDDSQELAAIIQKLALNRELRERIGAAGLHRVRTQFNWESRAQTLSEINCDILNFCGVRIERRNQAKSEDDGAPVYKEERLTRKF
jgi:phosphatidylinositol alpha-1,6-mannosyltransferase